MNEQQSITPTRSSEMLDNKNTLGQLQQATQEMDKRIEETKLPVDQILNVPKDTLKPKEQ